MFKSFIVFFILFNISIMALNIDEQIAQIQNAKTTQERVKLMNQFKKKLIQMNQSQRLEAISKLQSNISHKTNHTIKTSNHTISNINHNQNNTLNKNQNINHQEHLKQHIKNTSPNTSSFSQKTKPNQIPNKINKHKPIR